MCLLRGVNVGGRNRVPMAELRELFGRLGFEEVTTYIQSGNVVFAAPRAPRAAVVEAAIRGTFGLAVAAVVRSARQLERAVAAYPYGPEHREATHLGFLACRPPQAALGRLDVSAFLPERCLVLGEEAFFYLPDGVARTRLIAHVERALGVPLTLRNVRTVTKLVELTAG